MPTFDLYNNRICDFCFILIQKGVSNEVVTIVDGRIECSFTREAFLDDNDETYYDLREGNTYTIIMALGSSVGDDGK